jgi:hypothetical protein
MHPLPDKLTCAETMIRFADLAATYRSVGLAPPGEITRAYARATWTWDVVFSSVPRSAEVGPASGHPPAWLRAVRRG